MPAKRSNLQPSRCSMTVAGDCFAALATTARVKTELIILTRPLAARKSPPPPDSRSRRRGVSMTGGEAIRELRKSRPDVLDRKSVVAGQRVSVRVDLGGRRFLK